MNKIKPIVLVDTSHTPGYKVEIEMLYNGSKYYKDTCTVTFKGDEMYIFKSIYNKVVLKGFLELLTLLDVTPKYLLSQGFVEVE